MALGALDKPYSMMAALLKLELNSRDAPVSLTDLRVLERLGLDG